MYAEKHCQIDVEGPCTITYFLPKSKVMAEAWWQSAAADLISLEAFKAQFNRDSYLLIETGVCPTACIASFTVVVDCPESKLQIQTNVWYGMGLHGWVDGWKSASLNYLKQY